MEAVYDRELFLAKKNVYCMIVSAVKECMCHFSSGLLNNDYLSMAQLLELLTLHHLMCHKLRFVGVGLDAYHIS